MKKILIRFDDICPTMNWEQWEKAKQLLEEKGLVALLGVVPDCQDPDLMIDKARDDFWEYIKTLQKQGFTIAMHGYKHIFESGHSEFAGLPYEKQLYKIKEGKRILKEHGIETDVFFAPAHNYDDNTLRALSACGFKYMSDGLSNKPYTRYGITLLPCRCGGIPRIKKSSKYLTAVVHAHEWLCDDKKIDWLSYQDLIQSQSTNIVSFPEYTKQPIGNSLIQRLSSILYLHFFLSVRPFLVRIKRLIGK